MDIERLSYSLWIFSFKLFVVILIFEADLQLSILLPLPPDCWENWCVPPCLPFSFLVNVIVCIYEIQCDKLIHRYNI